MNYIICPYQLVSSEIWYTNPDGLAPEEVFFDVIREDFLINNQAIVFSDKHLKHVYSHIHINKPADGIALLKIANRLVEEDEQQVWDKFPGEDRQFATLSISRKMKKPLPVWRIILIWCVVDLTPSLALKVWL